MSEFNPEGLLSPGIHIARIAEVREKLGSFQKTDRRIRLMQKLDRFVTEVAQCGDGFRIVLDGSFVLTCVDAPEDIDILLLLPPNWDLNAEVTPQRYALFSNRITRRRYGFDVKVARVGSAAAQEWQAFFSQVKPEWAYRLKRLLPEAKGLIEVLPDA